MAWTVDFKLNTNEEGVGTATATNGTVTYIRERLDTNNSDDRLAFKNECIAKVDEATTKATLKQTIEVLLETELNS